MFFTNTLPKSLIRLIAHKRQISFFQCFLNRTLFFMPMCAISEFAMHATFMNFSKITFYFLKIEIPNTKAFNSWSINTPTSKFKGNELCCRCYVTPFLVFSTISPIRKFNPVTELINDDFPTPDCPENTEALSCMACLSSSMPPCFVTVLTQ